LVAGTWISVKRPRRCEARRLWLVMMEWAAESLKEPSKKFRDNFSVGSDFPGLARQGSIDRRAVVNLFVVGQTDAFAIRTVCFHAERTRALLVSSALAKSFLRRPAMVFFRRLRTAGATVGGRRGAPRHSPLMGVFEPGGCSGRGGRAIRVWWAPVRKSALDDTCISVFELHLAASSRLGNSRN